MSLSEPIDNDSDGNAISLLDVISCEDTMLEQVELSDRQQLLYRYLTSALDGREREILLLRYGLSGKEFDAVLRGAGGIDNLIDWKKNDPDITLMKYMEDKLAKEDKVFDNPALMRTPIVRNGKAATVGFCPDVWATWE